MISLDKVQGRAKVVYFEVWFVSISGACDFGSCGRHVLNEYSAKQPTHSLLQFRSGALLCFLVLLQKDTFAQALQKAPYFFKDLYCLGGQHTFDLACPR